MKVLFISDFGLKHNSGGAQVSNDEIIKQGEKMGHEIILHNFDSSPVDFLQSFDVVVSSNLEAINQTSPEKINYINNHDFHVRLEHDSCSYLTKSAREELFRSSKINFFLSEFHLSFFIEFYGNIFDNVEFLPDPIDSSIFKIDKNKDKIYDIVYCGFLHPLKGFNNLVEYAKNNSDRKFDIFGWSENGIEQNFKNINNIRFHGKVKQKEMASIYQSSVGVFHYPLVNEPFCRMIGESIMCGINDFHGDMSKIGSYLEYKKNGLNHFSTECSLATSNFWQKIENKL